MGTFLPTHKRTLIKLAIGYKIPDFHFKTLKGAGVSNKGLLGKYYLVDFWASWCSPCLAEMQFLHQAHKNFNGKQFEILSISFDDTIDDLQRFRSKDWKLPWTNIFEVNGFKGDAAILFDVHEIPKTILVDDTGMIIAANSALKGKDLDRTLKRALTNSKTDQRKHQ